MNTLRTESTMNIMSEFLNINKDIVDINRDILSFNMTHFVVEGNVIADAYSLGQIRDIIDMSKMIVLVQKQVVKVQKSIMNTKKERKDKNSENNEIAQNSHPENVNHDHVNVHKMENKKRCLDHKTYSKKKDQIKPIDETKRFENVDSCNTDLKYENNLVLNSLLNIVKDKEECDIYIVCHDKTLTKVINQTFREHRCHIECYQILPDIIIMNIFLTKKILISKFQKILVKGKRFGINFFLTKTGMISNIFDKICSFFKI